MKENLTENKDKIFIIDSNFSDETADEVFNNEKIISKLKLILKTLTSSELYYRKILDENMFETLLKLKNYESTLNCKLHNCLHKIEDLNRYLLRAIDQKEIKSVISRIQVPAIENEALKNDSDVQLDKYQKPSSIAIKTNPYCYSKHEFESSDNINKSRLRSCNNPIGLSHTNTSSSLNSTHSLNSSNCSENHLKVIKNSFLTSTSISCVQETSQTNISRSTIGFGKRYSLLNLNPPKRIAPLSVKSSTSSAFITITDELSMHANACHR